jgi:hypothetical protein
MLYTQQQQQPKSLPQPAGGARAKRFWGSDAAAARWAPAEAPELGWMPILCIAPSSCFLNLPFSLVEHTIKAG